MLTSPICYQSSWALSASQWTNCCSMANIEFTLFGWAIAVADCQVDMERFMLWGLAPFVKNSWWHVNNESIDNLFPSRLTTECTLSSYLRDFFTIVICHFHDEDDQCNFLKDCLSINILHIVLHGTCSGKDWSVACIMSLPSSEGSHMFIFFRWHSDCELYNVEGMMQFT